MKEDAVELEVSGLKCDTPKCGWRDDSIQLKDYHKYVGARCPICKRDVLTERDYRHVMATIRVTQFINKWFSWLPKRKHTTVTHIELNGTGKAKLTSEKI